MNFVDELFMSCSALEDRFYPDVCNMCVIVINIENRFCL